MAEQGEINLGAEAPAAPVTAGIELVGLDFTIAIPDLRNGDSALIQQAAPKASIDAAYRWTAIANLPPGRAVTAVEYLIRGTYATIVNSLGVGATDAQRADARRKAIVLGAVRAGAAAAFNLTRNDMTIAECSMSGYTYANDRLTAGNGTAIAKHALAQSMDPVTAVEVNAISALVYLGMSVPVLQGASLVASGHHYLPTTRNIFAGQKRQAWGMMSDAARAYLDAMGDTFDDMAFHKSCHPISPPAKRAWAKNPHVAQRLRASGHGAAAVRLPAIPSDAAIGKTGLALVRGAAAIIKSMGHTVSTAAIELLLHELEAANDDATERQKVEAIQMWAMSHGDTFGFCAGIVQTVHEASGTGRNTLLSAYSVRKIVAENATAVTRGATYARVAMTRMRESMMSGSFEDPKIAV